MKKAEENLDNLKTDYKKLCLSIRTTRLGKISEQWCQEIKEEKIRVYQWEKKFQDARVQEDALERDFLETQNEKVGLRSRGKIEELKATLQNCKLRVELLEMNNEHWKEQVRRFQGQIRDRDHIMAEAMTQLEDWCK
ncbi:hypothetical protein Golax_005590 [Gossypium laxum]|uniref:Uncharacterized protein n=1 Tax=Gossypium laxum TaxID=34288 RepID=A0A7J9A166_9ROSI|nr:hypothetical protein [Gossypium laxum]